MKQRFQISLFILASLFLLIQTSHAQETEFQKLEADLYRERLTSIILTESTLYAGGLFYLNNVWYKNHEPAPFHVYNDLPGWLQLDKAGHMYAAYYQSYYGIKALQWAGVSRKKAIWYGGSLSFLMQTPIEIFDGFYEGYGFSTSDIVANTLGGALVISQELLWDEQRITMKFSYSPTKYPDYRPSVFGESSIAHVFTDYNGQTYWLSVHPSLFFPDLKVYRWLNVAIGYGGDGMLDEFKNPEFHKGDPLPRFDRTRQWYLSFDVNLEALPVENKLLKRVFKTLNMIKFPAPALELNSSGLVVLHPVYF